MAMSGMVIRHPGITALIPATVRPMATDILSPMAMAPLIMDMERLMGTAVIPMVVTGMAILMTRPFRPPRPGLHSLLHLM